MRNMLFHQEGKSKDLYSLQTIVLYLWENLAFKYQIHDRHNNFCDNKV